MKKKVAIYQNTIGGGGRIKVIAAITRLLNEQGIIPDWLAFRHTIDESFLENVLDKPIQARMVIVPAFSYGLSEFKYIKINQIIDDLKDNYDLVINSNNTLAALTDDNKFIHYIHFPREARLLSQYHNKVIKNMLFRKFFLKIYNSHISPKYKGEMIGNSKFTRSAMQEVYPLNLSDIKVVYPPVLHPKDNPNNNQKEKNTVISLGRFGSHKNQKLQIKIAAGLPQLKFKLIGFVGNKNSYKYYEECLRLVERLQLKNIELIKNLAYDKVNKLLNRSQFFIHTMQHEPFGISTVEALFHRCIPVVNSSGGQKEIVLKESLRFGNVDEAIRSFQNLEQMSHKTLNKLTEDLYNHALKFSLQSFYENFEKILNKKLNYDEF